MADKKTIQRQAKGIAYLIVAIHHELNVLHALAELQDLLPHACSVLLQARIQFLSPHRQNHERLACGTIEDSQIQA